MGKVYFAADAHLGLDAYNSTDREKRFVGWLREINRPDTEALYLLGDIFDFWWEYKYVIPKGYFRIIGALKDLVDNGVKVYFFEGNHDLWTFSFFQELGLVKLKEPCITEIHGKKFCLGHGDSLGPIPLGYRILRGIFHSRFLQRMFATLHPTISFTLGRGWSKHNRLSRKEKYVFQNEEEPLVKWIRKWCRENGPVDYFVFGHFHTAVNLDIDGCGRLMIVDSWIDDSPYLVFDGEDLRTGAWYSEPKIEK